MSQAGESRPRVGVALSLADALALAAAPTFGAMALLTGLLGSGAMVCSPTPLGLGGMAPMYLLMSAFHLAPWIRLASRRRGEVRR